MFAARQVVVALESWNSFFFLLMEVISYFSHFKFSFPELRRRCSTPSGSPAVLINLQRWIRFFKFKVIDEKIPKRIYFFLNKDFMLITVHWNNFNQSAICLAFWAVRTLLGTRTPTAAPPFVFIVSLLFSIRPVIKDYLVNRISACRTEKK